MTTITDTLYSPKGELLTGELVIELNVATGVAGGETYYGRERVAIGTNGALSVSLVPNSTITPSGTYYRVTRILRPVGASTRDTKTETVVWVVPDTGTATVADVETLSTPTTTATYLPSQISTSGATSGQVLKYNGTTVVWSSDTGITSVALSLPAIFSVSGSPITSNGTLTATLATQTANAVWAGPTTGAAAAPTFRALVAADIPSALTIASLQPSADGTSAIQINKADGTTNVVTVDTTNARVGIGTASPGKKLVVSGGDVEFINNVSNSPSLYLTNNGTGGISWRFIASQTGDTLNGGLGLFDNTGGAYRWAISTSGSFGIGSNNTSPSGTAHIYDATASTGVTKLTVKAGAGQSTTNLLELQNNAGTVLAYVNSSGNFIADQCARINTGGLGIATTIPNAGELATNSHATIGGLIRLGGTTSSFPAIKRSSATLQVRLADDSAYAIIDGQHRIQSQSVPASAAASGTAGDIAWDSSFVYICTAASTWKRAAIATW